MGKRSEFERRPRNLYQTPLEAFKPLIPHLDRVTICEPCAGDGALAAHLMLSGFNVCLVGDIHPASGDVHERDALSISESLLRLFDVGMFVTNPPWPMPAKDGGSKLTLALIRHLSSLRPTWMLLPADMMHNVYAAGVLRQCLKIVSVGRVKWVEGSANTGKDNACWYLFGSGPSPFPGPIFIPRGPRR